MAWHAAVRNYVERHHAFLWIATMQYPYKPQTLSLSPRPCLRAPGVLVALPCAFVLRRFQVAADGTRRGSVELSGSVYEIALVILSAYMAYLVAEVLLLDYLGIRV